MAIFFMHSWTDYPHRRHLSHSCVYVLPGILFNRRWRLVILRRATRRVTRQAQTLCPRGGFIKAISNMIKLTRYQIGLLLEWFGT